MSGARTRGRFDAGLFGAVLAAAAGLVFGSTTTFLVAVIALVFVAFGRASDPPEASVAVERTVEETSPRPGQEVTVSLAVANVGSSPLPDVRVRDGVPDALSVVEGTPGLCAGLRPGEEVTVTYAVRAERGTATFGDPAVVVRGAGGDHGRQVEVSEPTTLTCRTPVSAVELASETLPYTGRIAADAAGEGVEFHSTREYQHGDPLTRIDWNRYAATDELTTVNFLETRAATVVVLVDAGRSAAARAGAGRPTALDLSEYAARTVASALLDNHNRVGVARHVTSCRYLQPGTGHDQTVRVERFFGAGPGSGGGRDESDGRDDADGSGDGAGRGDRDGRDDRDGRGDGTGRGGRDGNRTTLIGDDAIPELRKRLPADAQVVYCSPFLADRSVDVTKHLAAYGYPVTVVSPDVTTGETAGGTVARVERDRRLRTVRGEGVRTVDWSPTDPLDAALERAAEGWSG